MKIAFLIHAALVLTVNVAQASMEFQAPPNPLHPSQPAGERQTYVKKIRCEGAEYGLMYEQGGFQYTKPQVTGLCAIKKADKLATCRADIMDPKTAHCWEVAQKYYGIEPAYPKMICGNPSFEFTIRLKGKQIEVMSSEFEGISEAGGMKFSPIATSPAKLIQTGSSVCPYRLTEVGENDRELKICFQAGIGMMAAFSMIHNGEKVAAENTQLNCVASPNFNSAVMPLIQRDTNEEVEDISTTTEGVSN